MSTHKIAKTVHDSDVRQAVSENSFQFYTFKLKKLDLAKIHNDFLASRSG